MIQPYHCRMSLKDSKSIQHRDTFISVFIVVLLTTAKLQKQPGWMPLMGEESVVYETVGFYSAAKNEIILFTRKEMQPEINILIKIHQAQTSVTCFLSFCST